MTKKNPPAIFLMGPTASGKTDLAMQLCDKLPCEIISVDSALIYRGMDIGTAKPTPAERKRYPHHLIDIRDPAEVYSAAQFRQDALSSMHDITVRGKIPLLVGGTMMYFRSLLMGMSEMPEADAAIRADIEAHAEKFGWDAVHQQLAQVDPVSAARIHHNDPQRMSRALEVYRLTGITMTDFRLQEQVVRQPLPYQLVQIAIAPDDRAILHKRIARRFEKMLELNFIEEVRGLYLRGDLQENMPSVRSVGYRQVWFYLQGLYDYEQMQEKGIVATRQLAKRQFTWLKSWQELNWIYTDSHDESADKNELLSKVSEKAIEIINRHSSLDI